MPVAIALFCWIIVGCTSDHSADHPVDRSGTETGAQTPRGDAERTSAARESDGGNTEIPEMISGTFLTCEEIAKSPVPGESADPAASLNVGCYVAQNRQGGAHRLARAPQGMHFSTRVDEAELVSSGLVQVESSRGDYHVVVRLVSSDPVSARALASHYTLLGASSAVTLETRLLAP